MKYFHVDVFSSSPMSGNGLTVVFPEKMLESGYMLQIGQEFRQFETVFIFPQNNRGAYPIRIFTTQEELPFAGHPVLGAAAAIHKVFHAAHAVQIQLDMAGRLCSVESYYQNGLYIETMNQGAPVFISNVEKKYRPQIARSLNLKESDLEDGLPIEVVSTGLPYLIVPVRENLSSACIKRGDFEASLSEFGAKFVYLFDPKTLECRTWDNTGGTEDIATGSAAGPLCAYLVRLGVKKEGEIIYLHQGRYMGRPSVIEGWTEEGNVTIRGSVAFFASGEIE